jgi:hypothetical protein
VCHRVLKSATLRLNILEAAMDDDKDKNVVEKLVAKISEVVDNVVSTASQAAQHAMEADAEKMTGQPVAYVAGDSFISDPMMPLAMMPVYASKKRRPARKKTKTPAKKVAKKPVKKTDKKSKKLTTKKSKKSAKTNARKTARKGAKKMKAKKSKR